MADHDMTLRDLPIIQYEVSLLITKNRGLF